MGIFDFLKRETKQKRDMMVGTAIPGRRARNAMRLVGGIDAARVDRFAETWPGTPVTPDEMLMLWHRILQARSRDMAINDPYMRRFVRGVRANVIGHGPKLRCATKIASTSKSDAKTNAAVAQSWEDWGEADNCDVTGAKSWLQTLLLAASTLAIDGEVFVKTVSSGPYGLQLQMIDAVRCPVDYQLSDTGKGTFIRCGIEYDQVEKPVAYFFTSDDDHANYYAFDGRRYERVPAAEVCHVYRHDMVGQRRGFPWAMSALFRLKRLKGFEDNAAMNAEVGAGKMGLITWDPDSGPEADDDEEIRITAEGGTFLELPAGANLSKWDPSFPDSVIATFTKSLLRGVGAGLGMNYPSLGNDLEGVNFSSIRAGTIEERELWKEDQKLLIEGFCIPVFRRWIAEALLRGMVVNDDGYKVPPTRLRAIKRASTFHGRRWDWVDPKSDAAANRQAVDSLIKSPQEIIRERGGDPEEVLDEIAQFYQMAKEKGIPDTAIQAAQGDQVKVAVNEEPDGTASSESNGKSDK